MNEEEIILLGTYCEDLLSQDNFAVVSQQFDRHCFEHFMSADTSTEREAVYNKMRGTQDFLLHIKAYVDQKNALLAKYESALSQEDAPIEGID